jgi:hypothetical protein
MTAPRSQALGPAGVAIAFKIQHSEIEGYPCDRPGTGCSEGLHRLRFGGGLQ